MSGPPVVPRAPQTAEMVAAVTRAADPSVPAGERTFWLGVAEGYLAAFTAADHSRRRAEAADTKGAVCGPWETVNDSLRIVPNRLRHAGLAASGVLYGFKEATAERGDADECAACARRILTYDDDYTAGCPTGLYCDLECHDVWCSDPNCPTREAAWDL